MDELTKFIATLGFPIVLCCYLIIRMELILRELRDEVRSLNNEIKNILTGHKIK